MRQCAIIIITTVVVLIVLGICLLYRGDGDKDAVEIKTAGKIKTAGMTNENYYQQPYSDNDLRVSCFFENGVRYCP